MIPTASLVCLMAILWGALFPWPPLPFASVPYVESADYACTGWAAAPLVVVTAGHCARQVGQAKAVRFQDRIRGARVKYTAWPAEFREGPLLPWPQMDADVAVLILTRPTMSWLVLRQKDARKGEEVTIYSHAQRLAAVVGEGEVVLPFLATLTGPAFAVSVDTPAGGSGGPVVDHAGLVVGMVSRHCVLEQTCPHTAQGKPVALTWAVPASAIRDILKRAGVGEP